MPLPDVSVSASASADLPLAEAIARAAATVAPVAQVEPMPLAAALGRVLAADVTSPIDLPGADNAAMDGYAVRSADLHSPADSVRLHLLGRALAGHPWAGELTPGGALRVTTGAVLPMGADSVVPQELCRIDAEDALIVPARAVAAGANRRCRGDDLRAGAPALAAGTLLRPAQIALLAALGLSEVTVRRRLRVAFASSGDELCQPGQPLPAGAVYDSNRPMLRALLQDIGAETLDLGHLPDDPARIHAALAEAAASADAVVTTGGVSVGEADHLRATLQAQGDIVFWRVALRPGRPLVCGRLHQGSRRVPMFGLPGNPVAAMVAFLLVVRPALWKAAGAAADPAVWLRARLQSPQRKPAVRAEAVRVRLQREASGDWLAAPLPQQGSGAVAALAAADGLMLLPAGVSEFSAGDAVDVLVL